MLFINITIGISNCNYKFAPPDDLLQDLNPYWKLLSHSNNNSSCSSKGLLLIHVCGDDNWLKYVKNKIDSTGLFDEYDRTSCKNSEINITHGDSYNNSQHNYDRNIDEILYRSTILCYTTTTYKAQY